MFKRKNKKYGSYADKKKRNNYLKVGAIILGTSFCVAGIYQFVILDFYGRKVREETIAQMTSDDSGYVQVYELTKDLNKGDAIDATILKQVTRIRSDVPATYIDSPEKAKDMAARINLSQNTILTNDMIIDMEEQITDAIKNQDYNWIRVHAFLEVGNFVDIHYKELDGTDTIVASKKKITKLSGNTFAIDRTELEGEYINNSTVRAAVTGGELYTTIYPDPENQNPAEVTYVLDRTIQQEIEKNPEVINKSAKTLAKNAGKGVKVDSTKSVTQDKPNFAEGGN